MRFLCAFLSGLCVKALTTLMIHITIRVIGKVQGVNYRFYARRKAEDLGLAGFVKNEHDGSVFIEAEGHFEQVDKFVEWCKEGPPRAIVENVITKGGEVRSFTGFEIRT